MPRPHHLAWACCIVPLAITHAVWFVHLQAGLIEACNPYLDGCVSVSRAARSGDGLFAFRAVMLPYCTLLIAFWWLCRAWFAAAGPVPRRVTAAAWLGCIAAGFLALYVTYLGADGDTARFMRRYGINVFFGFTVLAQMLLVSTIGAAGAGHGARRVLTALCAALLLLGLASIPLQQIVDDRAALLNSIEWIYSVLMVSVYAVIGGIWRAQRLRLPLPAAG